MKKNIAMRVAAFLFILTMISTCAFATTFAKYTTSDSTTDTARVAKWGVEVEVSGYDVFNTNYNDTVISSDDTQNVVAPGTSGDLTCISITGTPEVDVNVAFTADLVLSGWKVDGDEYCPIVITVGTKDYHIGGTALDGTAINSVAKLESAVEAAIAKYTKDYNANTDLSTIGADAPVVKWAWAFEGNDDVKDTKLGDVAVTGSGPEISLSITCTVTQKD